MRRDPFEGFDAFRYPGNPMEPDGLLGEITNWILRTSRQLNRPLALGAAIAIAGTLCGRHLAGPTRAGTHLYIACIGGTGIGKDRPLKAVDQILGAAGLDALVTTGKFKSDSALEIVLAQHPCCVSIVDEIGSALLAEVTNRRASCHEQGLQTTLQQLWSTNFEPWRSHARAQSAPIKLKSPAFSIFGASTADEFYRALSGAAIDNGLINRFMVIRADTRAKPREVAIDPTAVPPSIIEKLRGLLPAMTGNLGAGQSVIGLAAPVPRIMPWAAASVGAMSTEFGERLYELGEADTDARPFVARTAEMAIRLATIRAAGMHSHGGPFAVTADDLRWGASHALASARVMMEYVARHMAENEHQVAYKYVYRVVEDAGRAGILPRDIRRRVAGRMADNVLTGILNALVAAEQVERIDKPAGPKGERPTWLYRARG